MTLSNVEGNVKVYDANGEVKNAEINMELNDTVRIVSELRSYCWIKFDDNKLIKMDSLSDITITREGKNYDVYLNNGNLFFNITKKLKADEALRFHSGWAVTNITGTSGIITVDESGKTSIAILEGKTEVSFSKPDGSLKSSESIELAAGKLTANAALSASQITTVSVSSGYALAVDKTVLNSDVVSAPVQINSSSIPGFAAVEIKNDITLQQKILSANTLLDVSIIKANADASLRIEEDAKAQSIEIKRQEKIEIERREQEEREKAKSDRTAGRIIGREEQARDTFFNNHEHVFEHLYEKCNFSVVNCKKYDAYIGVRCIKCNSDYEHFFSVFEIKIGDNALAVQDDKLYLDNEEVVDGFLQFLISNEITTNDSTSGIYARAYDVSCLKEDTIAYEKLRDANLLPAPMEGFEPEVAVYSLVEEEEEAESKEETVVEAEAESEEETAVEAEAESKEETVVEAEAESEEEAAVESEVEESEEELAEELEVEESAEESEGEGSEVEPAVE